LQAGLPEPLVAFAPAAAIGAAQATPGGEAREGLTRPGRVDRMCIMALNARSERSVCRRVLRSGLRTGCVVGAVLLVIVR